MRKVVTRLEVATLRECDHVITVSELQRRTLLQRGFCAEQVSVVRPGSPFWLPSHGTLPRPRRAAQPASARASHPTPSSSPLLGGSQLRNGSIFTWRRAQRSPSGCPRRASMLVGGGKQEANLRTLSASLGLDINWSSRDSQEIWLLSTPPPTS